MSTDAGSDPADGSGPKPTAHGSASGCSRREFFRRTGTAATATVALGAGGSKVAPRYSPVGRAAAIAPIAVIGIAAGVGGVSYLTSKAADKYLGDERDYSGYTGADALLQQIEVGVKEMQSADERVMTSIENNITNSENVALSKGKVAIIEEMNAGNPESDAITAMQNAIDEYYSTIQENILTHQLSQWAQMLHHYEQLDTHEDISDPLNHVRTLGVNRDGEYRGASSNTYPMEVDLESEIELLDGSTANCEEVWFSYGDVGSENYQYSGWFGIDYDAQFPEGTDLANYVDNPESRRAAMGFSKTGFDTVDPEQENPADMHMYLEIDRYADAWQSLLDARDSVLADLSGFVTDVYSEYSPGDIPTEDLVDPITAATELRQDYDNASGRSAHAAMLGIPTSAELSAELEIVSDEAEDGIWEVSADIFTAHVPSDDLTEAASISSGTLTVTLEPMEGVTYTVTTTDSESRDVTASEFTEDSGSWTADLSLNTPDTSVDSVVGEVGFKTGETYQPANWSEPLYIAYNYVDPETGETRGAFTQIESEFTIVSVTDSSGQEVTTFKTESRNNQTADVSALKDELQQLREEVVKMQEEAQEQDDGGGGSITLPGGDWFSGGAGGPIVGGLILVGGALGLGNLLTN